MKRFFKAALVLSLVVVLYGCNEDQRTGEKIRRAPLPEFVNRVTMECPKCGAPQRPYRIDEIKSYYRCTGLAPKFPYHSEKTWIHRPHDGEK